MLRRCLLLLLLPLLCVLWLAVRPHSDVRALARAPLLEDHSLTVVLPVISSTLPALDHLLAPLLVPTSVVFEVAVVCPHSLVAETKRRLRLALPNASPGHPKVTVYPWPGLTHHHQAALELAARVKTQWVLLLDEHGLQKATECDRTYLLHPRAVHVPVGPRGFARSSQLSPSDRVQPAAFLIPPFVVPTNLLAKAPFASPVWPALGNHVSKSTSSSFGGIVIGADILDETNCNPRAEIDVTDEESNSHPDVHTLVDLGSIPRSPQGLILLAFPRKEDLINFFPATCKLVHRGYTVLAYLYDSPARTKVSGVVNERNCTIPYFQPSKGTSTLPDWVDSLGSVPDVMIGLDHQDLVSSTFSFILDQAPFLNTTLMRLPRLELPYTEWIGTLTLQELRNWNVPEITLSVITNNRPHSLRRLLESIQRTLFYGDKVNIRINMDQTSDPETMHVSNEFDWPHGDVFLHHRVIHGGLLPAVVESWYPHCDDSYGLLLEDDVELSPLAYAWIKMTLLHYKYGTSSPSSSQLFGISLYQQKIIELRPMGRQPFDARALFRAASLADPITPYLSQIPCSWGALYFPGPWRAFHAYLSLRLSQRALPLDTPIVPAVRSNRWTRSWKKYFIELAYLRGYAMLYPNYEGYASLSTNHLEVGSHVRDAPGAAYEEKKRLFSLPLMPLTAGASTLASAAASQGDAVRGPRLLDLPGGTLPNWARLPVLDLVGELSSMEAIRKRGEERRSELDACSMDVASILSSVRDILCRAPV